MQRLDTVTSQLQEMRNNWNENTKESILFTTKEEKNSIEKGAIEKKPSASWIQKYNLAKIYYEYYGNLEMPKRFITKNGYTYDADGIKIGLWIVRLRQIYNKQGDYEFKSLLDAIGMVWNPLELAWLQNYHLAKIYYEHYGNLEVPQNFKTKNGYAYSTDGEELGKWIDTQRQSKKNKKLSKKREVLLKGIGMVWDSFELAWLQNYHLAKKYYEHHGNLNVKPNFRTCNGYAYDANGFRLGLWIANQRYAYRGTATCAISERHIQLLEEIGMCWFSDSVDKKLQMEQIQEKNQTAKKREIYNRFKSYLLQMNGTVLSSKEEMNEDFLNYLHQKK